MVVAAGSLTCNGRPKTHNYSRDKKSTEVKLMGARAIPVPKANKINILAVDLVNMTWRSPYLLQIT